MTTVSARYATFPQPAKGGQTVNLYLKVTSYPRKRA